MGRMVSRQETSQPETRYVYDGWNIVAEISASNKGCAAFANCVQRQYIWGTDVSGTTQGAGGIGGLLLTRVSANDYFTIFDGRGNLSGMLNTSGQVVAGYQYSAFGERVAAVGSMKDAFRFGWSTKFLDGHTNLLNFGLRWYDAANGRFVNRDPIGERGGINLYAFLANNPLGGYELLGMGFLSKLFKGIVNFIKKVVIRVVLAAIPFGIGVFLSAAYTAYMWGKSVYDGYRSGGVLGAVAGFVAGPGIGGGSSWAEVLKNAFSETLRKELIASAVRKVDRRVRGFAKWFGVASSIYSVYNGRSPVKESFAELSGALEGSISGSPQLGGKLRKGAETKYGEWGELEVVGPVSDEELRGDYGKTLRDMMSTLKATISPERAALEASYLAMKAASDAQIAAARSDIAGVANASKGPTYTNRDSARTYARTMPGRTAQHMQQLEFMSKMTVAAGTTLTIGLGSAALYGGTLTLAGEALTATIVTKGSVDLFFQGASVVNDYRGNHGSFVPGSGIQALTVGIGGEDTSGYGNIFNSAADVALSLGRDPAAWAGLGYDVTHELWSKNK